MPLIIRYRQALSGLDKLIYAKIEERKKTTESRPSSENNSLPGETNTFKDTSYFDMLSILIKSSDNQITGNNDKAVKMTNKQIRGELMTIFLVGHETTANALTWTFYLLSQHPQVESKIIGEIASVLGNENNIDDADDRVVTFVDSSKLKYT